MTVINNTFFFLFLLFFFHASSQSTIETVPNQKLINGSYVSNPDNILTAQTVREIDSFLTSLEQQTTVQVAVVALESIGEKDVFDFAQKLFNKWGIGQQTKDNGLLLLLVKNQRTVRFHTGYGLEGVLPDITCKNIQMDYMVPLFRQGDYNGGMLAGVQETIKVISDPVYAQELKGKETPSYESEGSSEVTTSPAVGMALAYGLAAIPLLIVFFYKRYKKQFVQWKSRKFNQNPMRTTAFEWLLQYLLAPLVILLIAAIFDIKEPLVLILSVYVYYNIIVAVRTSRMQKMLTLNTMKEAFSENISFIRKQEKYLWPFAIVFPLPHIFTLIYFLRRIKYYRNHPRSCSHCKKMMYKLDETADDQFLTDKQQTEERIKSIDYDVWRCDSCSSTTQFAYPSRFSKYSNCPSCHAKTYYLVSDEEITPATYSSAGVGEKIHQCVFCSYIMKNKYNIPKLVASSSSSGSSSSGSSSSGGGSWGGGSSGGGGASSSW